jgi:uncharacterized damage-inducible protein DinB
MEAFLEEGNFFHPSGVSQINPNRTRPALGHRYPLQERSMKRMFLSVLMLALLPAGQLLAQEHEHAEGEEQEHMQHDAIIKSIAPLHEIAKGYLMGSAELMPEELFSYRPSDEVRTFGEILGHVAGAQYMFCGSATGGASRPPENFEERTTKAGIIEALEMGFAACEEAYTMDDGMAMGEVQFFGNTNTRLGVLAFNVSHNFEHYGNLVVYFRANGMVPPSSQGGM